MTVNAHHSNNSYRQKAHKLEPTQDEGDMLSQTATRKQRNHSAGGVVMNVEVEIETYTKEPQVNLTGIHDVTRPRFSGHNPI